ncbi:hypothetical protein SOM10_08205 [Microbacterium sp. CFBP9023]|uniref:hypothetical protein n=1 Tax=Microbacterium sp. CFBP9023 TaxID=3096535 RepID=UPI002A6A1811|nr:hypothetical protein [Microbacterium sp. CFBP9023]MDY0983870.1 hypothetical protein [Microbacterium sp. CFBP9023]
MRVTLHDVSKGRGGQALPTTSLEFHSGAVRFALAETEQRPTVLGLIASGRMRPDTGRVTIDGDADNRALRRTIALVDAPDVSDPHADITLAGVVGEELMFAGVGATPLHARRWLNQLGFGELAGVAIGNVDPAARVRILCELAILRTGTEGIVLVSPDRHGGSPDGWWRIASEFADRGYAMLVVIGGSAAVALERMHELEAINASGPVEPLVLDLPGGSEPEPEPDSEAEPEPVPEPDPEPDPEPEPEAEDPDERPATPHADAEHADALGSPPADDEDPPAEREPNTTENGGER